MKDGYTLDHRETVIKTVYRHWVDLIPVIVASGASLGAAFAVVYSYGRFSSVFSFISPVLLSLIVLFLVILAISIFSVGLYIYRQNKLIITDMHLIQVVQRGLFSRSVSQLSMVRVQDVFAKRQGVFATLLDYGSIEVETAGDDDNFIFNLAPNPQEVADECLAVHEKYEPKTTANHTGP